MKKRIIVAILILLALVLGIVFGHKVGEENVTKVDNVVENTVEQVETNIEEILSGSAEGENLLEQGFEEEPEELLSRASTAKEDNFTIGNKQSQIVYFSQIDSRWKNIMYSNHGDKSQTIGTSGCGPTSMAMVLSGIKGMVYPNQLAELYVNNGYRSYNSGTYLSAFKFTADYFDMEFERVYNNSDAIDKVKNSNYVIVSCSKGLFTNGGHFVVVWKYEDTNNNNIIDDADILHIYDPYLYAGKFDTSARRGKVTLNGNDALVTVFNFNNYANTKAWFCFKHDNKDEEPVTPTPVTPTTETTYTVQRGDYLSKIAKQFNIDWRDLAAYNNIQGPKYIIYTGQVLKIPTDVPVTPTPENPGTVGQTRKLKSNTTLYSKSNLSGTTYNYLKGTTVKIIENVSDRVDKVLVPKTGREAYIAVSAYTVTTPVVTPAKKSTVGQTKTLKGTTKIYAKSNLKGTYYTYIPGTKVTIIENVSSSIDKIKVPKTGRQGYVSTSVYR